LQRNGRVISDPTAIFLRASVFGAALVAIAMAPIRAAREEFLPFLIGAGIFYVVLSSFWLLVLTKRIQDSQGHITLVCLDVLMVSAVIWAVGTQYGVYALLYYVPIIYAGARLDLRSCIASSVLAAAAYVFISLSEDNLLAQDLMGVSTFGVSALVLAAVVGLLSSELIARKELTESLGASLERLSAIYDVARAAWDSDSLEEVLRRTLAEVSNLSRTTTCFIALLSAEGSIERSVGGSGEEGFQKEAALAALKGKGRPGLVLESPPAGGGQKTILTLPLRTSRGMLGVVQVHRKEGFRTREVETLQALCAEVALAIENASLRSELLRLATTDAVTGLYNRAELSSRLAAEVARARRYGHPLSLLMVDIDGFKAINDRHGHAGGDRALCRLAEILRQQLRTCDTPGRWGGDEFCVLLPETPLEGSLTVAERIRKVFRSNGEEDLSPGTAQCEPKAGPRPTTLSIGIISNSDGSLSAEQLMTFADRALYAAKRAGRDQVKAFIVSANTAPPGGNSNGNSAPGGEQTEGNLEEAKVPPGSLNEMASKPLWA